MELTARMKRAEPKPTPPSGELELTPQLRNRNTTKVGGGLTERRGAFKKPP
jgi:hypothetical protein